MKLENLVGDFADLEILFSKGVLKKDLYMKMIMEEQKFSDFEKKFILKNVPLNYETLKKMRFLEKLFEIEDDDFAMEICHIFIDKGLPSARTNKAIREQVVKRFMSCYPISTSGNSFKSYN